METILKLLENSGLSHIDLGAPIISPHGKITGVGEDGFDIDYAADAGSYDELDKPTLEAIAHEISLAIDELDHGYSDDWE